MNKLSKMDTNEIVEINYTDLANKYYGSSTEASNTNEPIKLTFFARFAAFFDDWTQHSYDSWEKAGRPEREF